MTTRILDRAGWTSDNLEPASADEVAALIARAQATYRTIDVQGTLDELGLGHLREPEPETMPWAGWAVPLGYVPEAIARCRGCRLPILWCTTPKGRRSPHDRDGTSHFATCPVASTFRRPRAQKV